MDITDIVDALDGSEVTQITPTPTPTPTPVTSNSFDGPPRKTSTPQQWELFGSPGHVLMAKVNAMRLAAKTPVLILLASLSLIPAAMGVSKVASDAIGNTAGAAVGKVVGWFTPSPLEKTPAPQSRPFAPVMGSSITFDPTMLPDLTADVQPAMAAQLVEFTAKKVITECNFTAQVTDNWFDGVDATPKCRYSKDKSRLWVWAYVKSNQNHGPFAGLLMRRDGKVTYSNVAANTFKLSGFATIDPALIPRTMVEDFPELLVK